MWSALLENKDGWKVISFPHNQSLPYSQLPLELQKELLARCPNLAGLDEPHVLVHDTNVLRDIQLEFNARLLAQASQLQAFFPKLKAEVQRIREARDGEIKKINQNAEVHKETVKAYQAAVAVSLAQAVAVAACARDGGFADGIVAIAALALVSSVTGDPVLKGLLGGWFVVGSARTTVLEVSLRNVDDTLEVINLAQNTLSASFPEEESLNLRNSLSSMYKVRKGLKELARQNPGLQKASLDIYRAAYFRRVNPSAAMKETESLLGTAYARERVRNLNPELVFGDYHPLGIAVTEMKALNDYSPSKTTKTLQEQSALIGTTTEKPGSKERVVQSLQAVLLTEKQPEDETNIAMFFDTAVRIKDSSAAAPKDDSAGSRAVAGLAQDYTGFLGEKAPNAR
jgi:hypothetical protein